MTAKLDAPNDRKTLGLRLRLARRARKLTQQMVADHLEVTRTTMVAIENGERAVHADHVVRLADLYGRPLNELLRVSEPLVDIVTQFHDALLPSHAQPGLALAIDELRRLSEDYIELEEMCRAPMPRRDPPTYEVDRGIAPEVSADDVASAERNRLGLGDGPLPNLRDVLESDVGLRIFGVDMPESIAALCVYTDRIGGCCAINALHSADRQRWSLASAYARVLTDRRQAHVIASAAGGRDTLADGFMAAFASAFLMPAAGLSRHVSAARRARGSDLNTFDIMHLQRLYGVPFEPLVHTLRLRGLLAGRERHSPLVDAPVSEIAPRTLAEPSSSPASTGLPWRYQLLAVQALQSDAITFGQFARLVRCDLIEARDLLAEIQTPPTIITHNGDLSVPTLQSSVPVAAAPH
jgi:Zn-dependent peptidase ImmA (M78 family)/DNA-binding XRE family transcriptional regulator